MKTPTELSQHVHDLAQAFHVRVFVRTDMQPHEAAAAETIDDRRVIVVSPIIDDSTYAVALHELGHCLSPNGMLPPGEFSRQYQHSKTPACVRDVRLCIEEERAAWEWAHRYAFYWTDLMAFVERLSRSNYTKYARRFGVYVKEDY